MKIDPDQLQSQWVLARLAAARGDFQTANDRFVAFIDFYNASDAADAEELVLIGLAASEYSRWNRSSDQFDLILNGLYVDALEEDPDHWQAHYEDDYGESCPQAVFDQMSENPDVVKITMHQECCAILLSVW